MTHLLSSNPSFSLHGDDHVSQQTTRLVQLLESIDYPYEIPEQDLHATISSHSHSRNQSQEPQQRSHALGTTASELLLSNSRKSTTTSDLTPAAKFLDWLLENVSAETNWPGYQRKSQQQLLLTDEDPLDDVDEEEEDAILDSLDQEHWQLQNTLASLEKELSDLRALETHAKDTNRSLDMDIHDISVQLDATATKLEETARTTLSPYLNNNAAGQSTDVDMEREQGTPRKEPLSSRRFLYQFQEELLHLQDLDTTYLQTINALFHQILDTINLLSRSQSTTSPKILLTTSTSHLDYLFKRNPAHDQELVRLCSTYRATKMSHIRAMAQLKCLEDELQYMKDLDAQFSNDLDLSTDHDLTGDVTGDHQMYTIASSRNQQIQKTRKQEIELISVQRETARLMEEMEQLLSDPVVSPSLRHSSGSGQNSAGMTDDSVSAVVAAEAAAEASGGVLVDICERIARTDIELRFLSAAHRDYLGEQDHAIKELDRMVDELLEYYCLGMAIQKILGVEEEVVQSHKDVLWAAVEECRDQRAQSKRLNDLAETGRRSHEGKEVMPGKKAKEASELLDLLKRNIDLTEQARGERKIALENIQQMLHVKDLLDTQLLHRHSSTREVHFVPKSVQNAKDDLVEHTRQLQEDYASLNDQAQQQLKRKKSFSLSLIK